MMTKIKCNPVFRGATWLLCLACMVVVGFAYYQEYVKGMLPCTLCSIQRWVMLVIAVMLLMSLVFRFQRAIMVYVWSGLQCVFALIGLLAASRQWWLQWHPHSTAVCLPGFKSLLAAMPWHQALKLSWQGSTSCGDVIWHMLGVNVVIWSMLIFVVLIVHGVWRKS